MKRMGLQKEMKATIMAIVTSLCIPANAAIPRTSTEVRPLNLTCEEDFSHGLNIAIIEPIHSLNYTSMSDVQQMIPMNDMVSGDSGGHVASQIADRTISSFFNSAAVKNSDFGRSATRVQKSMEGNVALGGSQPDSIKHEFKFAAQPMQTRALIKYRGIANAELSYQAIGSKMNFEVNQRVRALASDLVYAHTVVPGDSRDTLNLRWVW